MARQDVIDTLTTHLLAVQRPSESVAYFQQGHVRFSRPIGLSIADHMCLLYSQGEGDLPDAYRYGSLQTAFLSERWSIKVFWHPVSGTEKREQRLLEQWDVRREITSAIRGDSKLGGNVSNLKIVSVSQDVEQYGQDGTDWDVLTIVFDTWDLAGEAVVS